MEDVKVIDVVSEKVAPESSALVVADKGESGMSVPRPVVSPDQAKVIMAEYEALKSAIATEADIDRHGNKPYYKKSYWRKLATFFKLTVDLVEGTENDKVLADGTKLYRVQYKATAPNGRACVGDGTCGTDEKGKQGWSWMQLMGTANTRAFNRAVSNLVGGGEVSAEEVDGPMEAAPQYKADTYQPKNAPAGGPVQATSNRPASDKQVNFLTSLIKGNKAITSEVLSGWLAQFNVDSIEALTSQQISAVIDKAKTHKGA